MKSRDSLQYEVFDWLRFPLMVFVVFIHVNSFWGSVNYDAINYSHPSGVDLFNVIRISISHVLAHIAVPMFFFISGYLFFNKLGEWNHKVYLGKLKRRVKTLAIPFLLWNSIAILVALQDMIRHDGIVAAWNFLSSYDFWKLYWCSQSWNIDRLNWLGMAAPMTGPYLIPLWYLRDLMVVMVCSPLLWYLFKYTKIWGLLLLLLSYVSLIGIEIPGFTPTAFFFFGAGAYFNLNKIDVTQWTWKYRFVFYAIAVVLWAICTRYNSYLTPTGNLIYPFFVIFGSIAMFNLATALVKKRYLIPEILTKSSFFIYVSHMILIAERSSKLSRTLFYSDNFLMPIIGFFFSVFVTIAVCVLCYWLLKRFTPRLCSILTGLR